MGNITTRPYPTYQEYLFHQASKLTGGISWLDAYEKAYKALLIELVIQIARRYSGFGRARKVLCLGARRGAEVQAFRALSFDCIGIDLNPGENNSLVLTGDFHHLDPSLPTQDVVYTNSLDHVLDMDLFLSGIYRVLNSNGFLLILHASPAAVKADKFASYFWDDFEDVLKVIAAYKFTHLGKIDIFNNNFFEAIELFRRAE